MKHGYKDNEMYSVQRIREITYKIINWSIIISNAYLFSVAGGLALREVFLFADTVK